jgi:hypothetical protein
MTTKNIIWKKPDGALAVTHPVVDQTVTSAAFAAAMLSNGWIPNTWVILATDYALAFPTTKIELWVWNSGTGTIS